jgi:hypothetical protein
MRCKISIKLVSAEGMIFYCKKPLLRRSSINSSWAVIGAMVFAAMVPEAATPGNPIPGKLNEERNGENT